MAGEEYWGYHWAFDIAGTNDNIKDYDQIYNFTKELVVAIDMIAIGEPTITFLLPGDPKEGYSMMQLIVTSNICAHFVNPNNTAYIDIFSCKPYEKDVALGVIKKYFAPTSIKEHYLLRQA
jgi:S-adenosylmethionine/arginine decarboxylase-like enzyme